MQDTCIVYAHGNPWSGVQARQQYLMRALARSIPVVYLDGEEDRKLCVTRREVEPGVTVVRGFTSTLLRLVERRIPCAAAVWGRWHMGWLRRRYRRIVFWNAENGLRPYRFVPHDYLVFDCIDPCFSHDAATLESFARREHEVTRAADMVFASADLLRERCAALNPNTHLLNNACAPEEYRAELLQAAPAPVWWPKSGRPIAAYLGSLDWRMDFAALRAAVESLPEVEFVLGGNVIPDARDAARELAAHRNVTVPGRLSVEEGRFLLAHCAVGLIPFTPEPMNDAINPVKMYAYALLGKPMAGTAVRELLARPEVVATGRTAAEFVEAVGAALARSRDSGHCERLRQFAMQNTWSHRAQAALRLLNDRADGPRPYAAPDRSGHGLGTAVGNR